MAALIPSRRDPMADERAINGVRADKQREADLGYDGTWVAHPDLVPVAPPWWRSSPTSSRTSPDRSPTALAPCPHAIFGALPAIGRKQQREP
jgi:malate synthase